jgi:hypothetical protein
LNHNQKRFTLYNVQWIEKKEAHFMKVKRYFKDISPKAWEHPADRAALVALRQAPGFSELLRKIIGATTEKSIRLITLSSSVRVSERQFPKIHSLAREVGDVLHL